MKVNVEQKEFKQVMSFRFKSSTIKSIKSLAKENNSTESAIVEYAINQLTKEDKHVK